MKTSIKKKREAVARLDRVIYKLALSVRGGGNKRY